MVGLLALGWWLVYAGGGTHTPLPHLLYIPILVAAWAFRRPGALLAAVAAGVLMGPLMPLDVHAAAAQETASWLSRLGLFALVGLVAGAMSELAARRLRALEAREARFASLVRSASDLIMITDDSGVASYASPSAPAVLGLDPVELVGLDVVSLAHPGDAGAVAAALRPAGRRGAAERAGPLEARMRHSDGSWRHLELAVTDLLDDPAIAGVVINARDVTERRAIESQLLHQTLHDPLTGLANQELLAERVGDALKGRKAGLSVLVVDLDRFKTVNDAYGHQVGDQVLRTVAERLEGCLRPGDLLARADAGDFAMLCERITDGQDAARVAQRLLAAVREPLPVGDEELFVTAAVGVAVVSDAQHSPEAALREAYTAMRSAKAAGGDRWELFAPASTAQPGGRLKIESALRRAVERRELRMLYQPIIDLATGRIAGVEALLRWHHPRRGVIPPAEFIPIAEASGSILPIGSWAIRHACALLRELASDPAAPATVAVNLSPVQLRHPGLVSDVRDALTAAGLPGAALVVEITEGSLIQHAQHAARILDDLRGLGVKVAIDDFGTGYSSLGYLHQLPVDILKIDRVFIRDLQPPGGSEPIVSAVIGLAHSLNLDTVAEGVETAQQAAKLRQLGCRRAQGHHYSKPRTPASLRRLLRAQPIELTEIVLSPHPNGVRLH